MYTHTYFIGPRRKPCVWLGSEISPQAPVLNAQLQAYDTILKASEPFKVLWLAEESHCWLVFEVWTHPWFQPALRILSTKMLRTFETLTYFLMKQWPEIFLIPRAQISP